MSLSGLFSKKKGKGSMLSKMPSFKRKSAPLVVPKASREEVVAADADSATPDSVEEDGREEVFLPAMAAAAASDITQDGGSLNSEGSVDPTTTTTTSSSAHLDPTSSRNDDRVTDGSESRSSTRPVPVRSLSEVDTRSKPQYVNTPSHHKSQDTTAVAATATGHGATGSPADHVDSIVPSPVLQNDPSTSTTQLPATADAGTGHVPDTMAPPPTADCLSSVTASRGSGDTGGQFLSSSQPVGALASAKLRISEGRNATSSSSLRDLDKDNMSVVGRSKTISVVHDSLGGPGGEGDVELRRVAVRRAKQSRNKPPPTKPLPYATTSRKLSADSVVYKEASNGSSGGGGGGDVKMSKLVSSSSSGGGGGSGDASPKTSKLVPPPVAASKSYISPKRPAPPPPKHAPFHRSTSSMQSPAKSLAILHPPDTPPPSNPPPRFPLGVGPPSPSLADSRDQKRSTLPRRGTPAMGSSSSSSSSNTSTLPTKKHLSWGATSMHSVHHSPPPSSSHSNPSTLTRGSDLGIPPRGVTAATATKTITPAASLPPSTSTALASDQKESGPIYEEIRDWVGVARSLPSTRVHSLSSMYGQGGCQGVGQGAWSSASSPKADKAGTKEQVSDDEADEYVDMQPLVTAKLVTKCGPTAKAGSEVTPGKQAEVKDEEDPDYIDMQPLKVTVLSTKSEHHKTGEVRQDQEIYVEMQPASRYPAHNLQAKPTGLYPAPESPPPIYAPIVPSTTAKQPKQDWEDPSSDSLYYASRDLLALRKS